MVTFLKNDICNKYGVVYTVEVIRLHAKEKRFLFLPALTTMKSYSLYRLL